MVFTKISDKKYVALSGVTHYTIYNNKFGYSVWINKEFCCYLPTLDEAKNHCKSMDIIYSKLM